MEKNLSEQKQIHRSFLGLLGLGALIFAWGGFTTLWQLFLPSLTCALAAVAWLKLGTGYEERPANVHVAPRNWWLRRVPAMIGLPSFFLAVAAERVLERGLTRDALLTAAFAIVFVAALWWAQREMVDRLELMGTGLRIRAPLGLRNVLVDWADVEPVKDEGLDASLRVRDVGKFVLSHELSDFGGLLTKLRDQKARDASNPPPTR